MTLVNDNPTILEECQLRMHVDRVENMLCDSYIVEFSYDPTCSYYERGKYGYRNFHVTKLPLVMLRLLFERIDIVDQRGGEQATNNFQLFFHNLNFASKQVIQICNQVSNLYDATTTSTRASKGNNTIYLAQVKVRDNQEWSRWRRGCVTEVPSF